MTKTTSKDPEAIVRRLVEAYVSLPEELEIGSQVASDGSRYVAMRGADRDSGSLIGTKGTHARSLHFLVRAMGAAAGQVWTFRLVTPPPPEGAPPDVDEAPDAVKYDPKPALELLTDLLLALKAPVKFVHMSAGPGPRTALTFLFVVKTTEAGARAMTTTPPWLAALRDDRTARDIQGMTLVESIGTLFRAVGKAHGVKLVISIDPPPPQK